MPQGDHATDWTKIDRFIPLTHDARALNLGAFPMAAPEAPAMPALSRNAPREQAGRGPLAALRGLLARLFARPSPPPRQSDIERALLRALGGL